MEQLIDGLQLVGFLIVAVTVLAALVAAALGLAVCLYVTNRKLVVLERSRYSPHPHAPVQAR